MAVALKVYSRTSPSTLIATLDQPYDISWLDELTEVGAGKFTIPHDSPVVQANPSVLDEGNIVRVNIDGTDRFAWVVARKNRRRGDGWDPVTVSGPGVLEVVRYGDVYPEYWPSRYTPDERLFGFMARHYVPAAGWTAPASFGTRAADPFGDSRPAGWSDDQAEYITDSTVRENRDGYLHFLADLVVPEHMDVRIEATADETFDLWVAGIPLLESDGEYKWRDTYYKTITLPAGTYRVAAKVHHDDRVGQASTNIRWFMFSAMRAGSDGTAAAKREVQQLWTDATSGTLTATYAGGTTAPFAYNASAGTVETELNALQSVIDAGGVTVTGAGTAANPWTITFNSYGDRPQITGTSVDLNAGATITATTTTDGSDPDVLLRSNTTAWQVLPIGQPAPGMTPGHILRVLIAEAQARGCFPTVTLNFTDTTDADGTPWAQVEFAAQVGNDNVLSVGHRLGDLDVDLHMSPTLVLSAYHLRGATKTATVELAASQCADIGCDWHDDVVNTLLLRTERIWHEAPTPAPTVDRWEGFLSLGALPSEAVARDIAASVLATYADPREVVTYLWPDEVGADPYLHFDLGDSITAPGWATPTAAAITGRATRMLAVGGRLTDTGSIEWTAEGEQ